MATSMTSTPWLLLWLLQHQHSSDPNPPSMAAMRCYCLPSTATVVQRRKTLRMAMIRASMDACSSSESKKSLNSVSFTGKVNKVYTCCFQNVTFNEHDHLKHCCSFLIWNLSIRFMRTRTWESSATLMRMASCCAKALMKAPGLPGRSWRNWIWRSKLCSISNCLTAYEL